MNIYQLKNELNADKAIKKLKKNYKKETNDTIKIVVKKIDEDDIIENLAISLEFWTDNEYIGSGKYKIDELIILDYWQTKKRPLKEYNKNEYNYIFKLINSIIFNEMK